METSKWYVISEAIGDGESVEVHRIAAQVEDDVAVADPAKTQAEEWARAYSEQTGKPTTIDVVWVGAAGEPEGAQEEGFYYDPAYPQRDPYQRNGY